MREGFPDGKFKAEGFLSQGRKGRAEVSGHRIIEIGIAVEGRKGRAGKEGPDVLFGMAESPLPVTRAGLKTKERRSHSGAATA